MMGCNIRFRGVIWEIIPKLSLLPLLIWSTDNFCKKKEGKESHSLVAIGVVGVRGRLYLG